MQTNKNAYRRTIASGFGLVDVLIATICIAVMASMLLPLLLQMRSEARLDTCQVRIRTIVIAGHNYHDSYRRMPPATLGVDDVVNVSEWNKDEGEKSWKSTQNSSSLLLTAAFTDLRPEWNAAHDIAKDLVKSLRDYNATADVKFDWQGDIEGLDGIMSSQHDSLTCPEDDLADISVRAIIATQTCQPFEVSAMESNDHCRDIATQLYPGEEESIGLTNFVACIGVTGSSWDDDRESNRWRGAMTMRSRITLEGIRDGTSRTIMYGESIGEIVDGERRAAMSWLWGGGARLSGDLPFDPTTLEDADDIPMFGTAESSSGVGFGSRHEDVVTFGLCDGSVRQIKRDVDHMTLKQLAGKDDGGIPLDF